MDSRRIENWGNIQLCYIKDARRRSCNQASRRTRKSATARRKRDANGTKALWIRGKTTYRAGGVRFADLNGDGRAEYLYLEENGAMTTYIPEPRLLDWRIRRCQCWVATPGRSRHRTREWATRDNVILADVNGDGRADYLSARAPVTHIRDLVRPFSKRIKKKEVLQKECVINWDTR
ncbi:hypothetical protein DFH06DRAFT_687597 [Mycena polygramma]|nr:hypothetical protein DFH06DRAFT_687597 [Mycena polygramma]